MGDLSKHFSRYEFACKCGCGYDTVDAELITVLEALREHFDRPVTINSGCRCSEHNENIEGGKKSQHLIGRAADIVVKKVDSAVVYRYLTDRYIGKYGIGGYAGFTHIDTRSKRARW